jgi:Mrp family chromosome partitioning ATPase
MTKQTKFPLDEVSMKEAGDSLIERAGGAFGLDNLKPVAVPEHLRKKTTRPARAKQREQARAPAPAQAPQVPQGYDAGQPAVQQPAAVPSPAHDAQMAPAQQQVEPEVHADVEFSDMIHPISRDHLSDQGMIVPDGPLTGLLEEFRIVKRQLLNDARRGGTAKARRILVCSPHSGEGKTYCATNLALALAAERDIEVLLVDADIAKPSVLEVLGLDAPMGFMDALSDPSIMPEELVLRTDVEGLFVLPSGNRTNSDTEYLASERTREVLSRLTESAPDRIVIFDTPPTLSASPAAELAKHVGQAILVARADVTGRNALEDAYQLLSACPEIKLLLNGAQFSPSGRNFGSYGVYGE